MYCTRVGADHRCRSRFTEIPSLLFLARCPASQPSSSGTGGSTRSGGATVIVAFVVAVVTLLAVPGPTNTLLAASGAAVGFQRSLRLIIGETTGYLVAIVILMQILAPFVAGAPAGPIVAKAFASVVLILLAIRLWRRADAEMTVASGPISIGQVFVTTLFNPKALIFAFVIFPRSHLQDLVTVFRPLRHPRHRHRLRLDRPRRGHRKFGRSPRNAEPDRALRRRHRSPSSPRSSPARRWCDPWEGGRPRPPFLRHDGGYVG